MTLLEAGVRERILACPPQPVSGLAGTGEVGSIGGQEVCGCRNSPARLCPKKGGRGGERRDQSTRLSVFNHESQGGSSP